MKHQLRSILRLQPALLVAALGLALPAAQAQHINAGTLSQGQGGQLSFIGAGATPLSPGFQQLPNTITLSFSNSGTFAGLFTKLNGPTFTALAYSNSPFAAALGSFLELNIVSVSGPAGANFFFYDEGALAPTFTLPTGSTGNTAAFDLSEGTADPYGHIHGRYYAVDQPGTYSVGFQIFDASHNGLNGGPIQAPSDVYYLTYKTAVVPEPSVLAFGGLLVVAGLLKRKSA